MEEENRELLDRVKSFEAKFAKSIRSDEGIVLIFADCTGSSAKYAGAADVDAARMVYVHNRILSEAYKKSGGIVIKEIGDEVMIRMAGSSAPYDSIVCAVETMKEFELYNSTSERQTKPKLQIHSKIAIHFLSSVVKYWKGKRSDNNFDLLGHEVNIAARIASIAGEDQIIVSDKIYDQAISSGMLTGEFSRPYTLNHLKNITDTVTVYESKWNGNAKGIDQDKIHSIVLLDISPGTNPESVLNEIKTVFQGDMKSDKIYFGGVILGYRKIILRMKAYDLNEHREMMMLLSGVTRPKNGGGGISNLSMTYTYFLHYPKAMKIKKPDVRDFDYGALMFFSLEKLEQVEHFMQDVENKINHIRSTSTDKIHIADMGTIFGEREVYVVVQSETRDELKRMVFEGTKDLGVKNIEAFSMIHRERFDGCDSIHS